MIKGRLKLRVFKIGIGRLGVYLGGVGSVYPGDNLLLEGDVQSGIDILLLSGDMQNGTDALLLSGTS